MREATSLVVKGDWTFGGGVKVRGDAVVSGSRGRIAEDTVLGDADGEAGS